MNIKKTILFILVIVLLCLTGCSERKAERIFETGQFEELQYNRDHARELYLDIIKTYPDSKTAIKARERLQAMDSIDQSNPINNPLENKGGQPMSDPSKSVYEPFDHPSILSRLFHPRKEMGSNETSSAISMDIPVDDHVTIGAKMHVADPSAPTILFFHGNGEIVSDYDDIAPLYTHKGINFLAVDYRGYGRSTGSPTVQNMMADAHFIFKFTKHWLKTNHFKGPLIVMGRSLGSASALELAANYPDDLDGLIIESGFAYAIPLINLLGVNTDRLNISKETGFDNIDKISRYHKPTLVIHAEFDHIIPFSDGKALFDTSPAAEKKLLKIPQADHNTIFSYGMNAYMNSIKDMVSSMR